MNQHSKQNTKVRIMQFVFIMHHSWAIAVSS